MKRDSDDRLCRGAIEGFGEKARFHVQVAKAKAHEETVNLPSIHAALEYILKWTSSESSGIEEIRTQEEIHAVGHRVVHGGERFSESVVINGQVLKTIEQCIDIAPLHNPASIDGIRSARAFFGVNKPQVAVFDTAFHHTMPRHVYLYAVPYRFYEQYGVRRYGFHGTSHRYVAHRYRMLRNLSREQTNIISLHLGNGCSACAIRGGMSIDTSMGMTPLEGLVMGTRSGDIDPALVGFIGGKEQMTAADVEKLLNKQSGLLGVSGISGDMRTLSDHDSDAKAHLAVEMFCYRARKYIGAYLAAMGGADAVIFTGGIGENSPQIRARICDGLQFAGLTIDSHKNESHSNSDFQISTDDSPVAAYCIHTDEELLIARDTVRCILGLPHPS